MTDRSGGWFLVNFNTALFSTLLAVFVASPSIADDRLQIQGIVGGDNVVVMMDARTGPDEGDCTNDRIKRSTGDTSLGNVRSRGRCNSQIAILSANNAMLLEAPIRKRWTDATGEIHTVTLEPIIDVPVSVWIVNDADARAAVNDMARANLLFDRNKVGVQFVPTFKNKSGDPNAVRIINAGIHVTDDEEYQCKDLSGLRRSAFFTPKTLNVYYVKQIMTGKNCAIKKLDGLPRGDGNITYIGTLGNRATLAHEFGHAFGLRPGELGGHTNPDGDHLPGFGPDNIMTGEGSTDRKHFSLGQVFRMNTHVDRWGGTMLIKNGFRRGPGRECPPLAENKNCPALRTDWDRP